MPAKLLLTAKGISKKQLANYGNSKYSPHLTNKSRKDVLRIKSKKLITTLCTTAIIGLLGATSVFAANTGDLANKVAPNIFFKMSTSTEGLDWSALTDEQKAELETKKTEMRGQVRGFKISRAELTEEQLAEIEAKMPELAELTDEQKAEMEAKRTEIEAEMAEMKTKTEAMNEKWTALTTEQKEEIYALKDQAASLETQIIDKYLELGLIDEQTAADMKDSISENSAQLRESGKMPAFGGQARLGGGKAMFHIALPAEPDALTDSADTTD